MAAVKTPRVSIVVTNYNYASYVEACLDSIAAQSVADFECLVVDDASTDNSCEIIERFIDSAAAAGRFRLRAQEQNAGQMIGFTTGLAETGGELVVFVDADDTLLPDFLEVHLKAHLNPHHSVAFTCSDQLQINRAGEVLSATNPTLLRDARDPTRTHKLVDSLDWVVAEDGVLEVRQPSKAPIFVPPITADTGVWRWSATSAMMFRRATLELILAEDCQQFRLYADYYLCMFAHVIGGSLIIPTVHGCYRRHGENAFSAASIVGSDRSLHDLTRKVPLDSFHDSFVTHVIRNFDRFRAVVDENQLYMIVAKFSSPGRLREIDPGNTLNRTRLRKCRMNWRLAGFIVWLRSRFFWLRRITSSWTGRSSTGCFVSSGRKDALPLLVFV